MNRKRMREIKNTKKGKRNQNDLCKNLKNINEK